MITASEAREMYNLSGAVVEDYIKRNIEAVIRSAATAGKRQIFHMIGSHQGESNLPVPSSLQTRIIAKLIELGFSAQWEYEHGLSYIQRARADLDSTGPRNVSYGILISW